jgi:mono/diheme cytochrome c family protein
VSQDLWKLVPWRSTNTNTSRKVLACAISFLAMGLWASAIAMAAPQNATGNADNGKQLFSSVGCAGCHGPLAKGMSGLAPQITPPPFPLPDFISFVRHPAGAMRPFSKDDVSDTQLGDIYAYLQSLSPGSATPTANLTGNAENGKRLFMRDGCYECHGILGQGANGYAPRIAPDPISLQAIMSYIRKPAGNMPPYTARIVPDQDVADIYAYLKSVPRPTDLKNVPTFSK